MGDVIFQQEILSQCFDELEALAKKSHDETGAWIPLAIDRSVYKLLEMSGAVFLYTARVDGKAVGLCLMLVSDHPHYQGKRFAKQDIVFVEKEHRGITSVRFLRWVDEQLEKIGADAIIRQATAKVDVGGLLVRMGYEEVETSYIRRM